MTEGDLTVTLVGSYNTLDLAIAAMNAGSNIGPMDYHEVFVEEGVGRERYKVLKYQTEQ